MLDLLSNHRSTGIHSRELHDDDNMQWVISATDLINEIISETVFWGNHDHVHVWLQNTPDGILSDLTGTDGMNIYFLSTDWGEIRNDEERYLGLMDIVGEIFEKAEYEVTSFDGEPTWRTWLFGADNSGGGHSHMYRSCGGTRIAIGITIKF